MKPRGGGWNSLTCCKLGIRWLFLVPGRRTSEKFLIQPVLLVLPKPATFSPPFDHEALEDLLLSVFPVLGMMSG